MEEVTSNKEKSKHTFWSLQQLQFAEKELSEIINLNSNQKLKGKKGETEDNKTKLQNWSNNTLSDNKITRLKQLILDLPSNCINSVIVNVSKSAINPNALQC